MLIVKIFSARCLRSTWNLAIAIATIWYLIEHNEAATSLQDALGDAAILWQVAIAITHLIVGVLGAFRDRIRILRIKGLFHVAAATTLVGYALGIIFTPPPDQTISDQISTAVGLALGAVAMHILRWREIEMEVIPAILTLRELAAEAEKE